LALSLIIVRGIGGKADPAGEVIGSNPIGPINHYIFWRNYGNNKKTGTSKKTIC